MNTNKAIPLTGENNKRIKTTKPTNSEMTAAWSNEASVLSGSQVSIPSEESVIEAKEWVDDGSRL